MSQRLKNEYDLFKEVIGPPLSPDYPSALHIELTSACSLACIMCSSAQRLDIDELTLSLALYQRLVDEVAPYVMGYALFKYGESLLLEDFGDRVRYLAERKLPDARVYIYTNGMLLDEEMSHFLLSHNTEITISFDGADKETFEGIRRGASFDRICRNVSLAARIQREHYPEAPAPAIHPTIQRDNIDQLEELLLLADRLGTRRISFGYLEGPAELSAGSSRAVVERIGRAFRRALSLGMALGECGFCPPVVLGEWAWDGQDFVPRDQFEVNTLCDVPNFLAVVNYDGSVSVCCREPATFGDLHKQAFSDIWRSQEYEDFRGRVNNFEDLPPECRKCPSANR